MALPIGTLGEIWRYPVKSMGGEQLPVAKVEPHTGIRGDRLWAVFSEPSREILSARKLPGLLRFGAKFRNPEDPSQGVLVEAPGNRELSSEDQSVHAALSAHLGLAVSLWPVFPREASERYRKRHMTTPSQLRAELGRPAPGPMPDLSRMRLGDILELLRFMAPRGTFFDMCPLHIVTRASLDALEESLPGSSVDVRRFRPNLVLETGPEVAPFTELDWTGWELHIGGLVLACRSPTVRCTVPGQRQKDLRADPRIQAALCNELGEHFGFYAIPKNSHTIELGDRVSLLPPARPRWGRWQRALEKRTIQAIALPMRGLDLVERGRGPIRRVGPEHDYRPLRVMARTQETPEVTSLLLASDSTVAGPSFLPGQHLVVKLDMPEPQHPVVRAYSISNSPFDRSFYRITVQRRRGGLASEHLHHRVRVGDAIQALGPIGSFFVHPWEHTPVALLGTGIGVTPLASMAAAIAHAAPQREVVMILCMRSEESFPLHEELVSLSRKSPNFRLHVRYSRSGPHVGRWSFDAIRRLLPHLEHEFFLCGRREFTRNFHAELVARGVPATRIYSESFNPATSASLALQSHEVTFVRSKVSTAWSGGTLLELAESHGVRSSSGCRYGSCGSCEARLLAGSVDHDRGALAPVRPGHLLLCSSRPKSRLLIDL